MENTKELYSVRDIVAEEFGPIFEAKNEGVAKRQFLRLIKENKLDVFDYHLYRVGYFTYDGELIPELTCVVVDDIGIMEVAKNVK